MEKENISYTVENDLCLGRGVYQDVCPLHTIEVKAIRGTFSPIVNEEICASDRDCRRCFGMCSSAGINLKQVARNNFNQDDINYDTYIGYYRSFYVGHSTDKEIRYHCTSGGMTSRFIMYLLEKKIIEGTIVTKFNNKDPLMVNTFIARNKEEVLSAKGSKYAPITMVGIADFIKNRDGGFVIVDLPCHIHGFRKLELIDKRFKQKIFVYFGLYCSCGYTFCLTDHTLENNCISRDQLTYFTYRDNGCTGNLHIRYVEKNSLSRIHNISKNKLVTSLRIPYQKYCLTLRSFFNIYHCLYYTDHFTELSDISFGDIHFGEYTEDKLRTSSVVTRRSDLDNLLREAKDEGYITLDRMSKPDLSSSQKYAMVKKHTNPTIIKIYRTLGFKTSQYNEIFKTVSTAKAIKLLMIKKAQMFIDDHESL